MQSELYFDTQTYAGICDEASSSSFRYWSMIPISPSREHSPFVSVRLTSVSRGPMIVSKLISKNCFGIMEVHIVLAVSKSLSEMRAAFRAPTDEPDTAIRFFSSFILRRASHTPSW